MEIRLTERFLRDFQTLSTSLSNKCRELIAELHQIEPNALRQKALPGWRLHSLNNSNLISLSVDMNFRALGELDGMALTLHRVVKHDTADRANVNRNSQANGLAQISNREISISDIYDALRAFGIKEIESDRFRGCLTEEDLLNAAANVTPETANLALTLFETSGIAVPQARYRVLQRNEDLARILEDCESAWELYLHPSQEFIVELPNDARVAVVGSAGTGKTVCAWHRSKHLIAQGVSVGFVCPHQSVLDISKNRLLSMAGPGADRSYFFVPHQPL